MARHVSLARHPPFPGSHSENNKQCDGDFSNQSIIVRPSSLQMVAVVLYLDEGAISASPTTMPIPSYDIYGAVVYFSRVDRLPPLLLLPPGHLSADDDTASTASLTDNESDDIAEQEIAQEQEQEGSEIVLMDDGQLAMTTHRHIWENCPFLPQAFVTIPISSPGPDSFPLYRGICNHYSRAGTIADYILRYACKSMAASAFISKQKAVSYLLKYTKKFRYIERES